MNKLLIALLALTYLSVCAPSSRADVSFQVFYDALGDSGQWVQIDGYGYAWQPNVEDPDWSPYTEGHWVYTDYGWTWVSDEPWGWATYHYGRWLNIDDQGWFWIPGYRWAPAWVSWRYGGGYCGWAPLPPRRGGAGGNTGFDAQVDINLHIGAGAYRFCPEHSLGERSLRHVILNRSGNDAILAHTANVTDIRTSNVAGDTPYVRGPVLAAVNAGAEHPVQQLHLQRTTQAGPGTPPTGTINGNTLQVYAPPVARDPNSAARPGVVAGTLTQVHLNRGDDPGRPLQSTSHGKASPSSPPEGTPIPRPAQSPAPAVAVPPHPLAPHTRPDPSERHPFLISSRSGDSSQYGACCASLESRRRRKSPLPFFAAGSPVPSESLSPLFE